MSSEEPKDYFDIFHEIASKSVHRQPQPAKPPKPIVTFSATDSQQTWVKLRQYRMLAKRARLTEEEVKLKEELKAYLQQNRIFI